MPAEDILLSVRTPEFQSGIIQETQTVKGKVARTTAHSHRLESGMGRDRARDAMHGAMHDI